MERSTPMRKSHTSTANLLTWPEIPPSYSPSIASAACSYQPSDGISKVVFGGQVTDEEVENLKKSFGEHDMDGMPENSKPEQKQGHEDDLAIGGGEKRWPWWPGESVFQMLVPVQKVGSIIGCKGEYKCVKRQELALRFLMVLQELQKEL